MRSPTDIYGEHPASAKRASAFALRASADRSAFARCASVDIGALTPDFPVALRRKPEQIPGTIAHYERLLREAEHDLAHVNAALRLFEATGQAPDLPPYIDLNRVLRRGETTKICMDALAAEGPLDTRQLALRVIRAKGLSESDKVVAQTVALRIVQTLRMRARRNKVECITKTKGVCVWQLPTGPWRPTEELALE